MSTVIVNKTTGKTAIIGELEAFNKLITTMDGALNRFFHDVLVNAKYCSLFRNAVDRRDIPEGCECENYSYCQMLLKLVFVFIDK